MLSDKIWITRKSRIYTEKRLLYANNFSNILVVWYSSFVALMTIWNLQYPDEKLNIILVIGSIAVLVASVVLASQKFTERSLAIKHCYIKLDELYSKTKKAEGNNNESHIIELEKEYSEILESVENHSDYDYLYFRFEIRNNQNTTLPAFTCHDHFLFLYHLVLQKISSVFWLALPIVLGLAYFLYIK